MTHFAIIANGEFLKRERIEEAIANKMVIALDGATNHLQALGIKPDIMLGDFDSIDPVLYQALSQDQAITIVPAKNQDQTDLTKALDYCDAHEAESITLLCALHLRLDHHESTLHSLRAYHQPNRPLILHTHTESVRFAKDETVQLQGNPGELCAVLGYPKGSLTSYGLQYEVQQYPLEMGHSESISNRLIGREATLIIQGEALIIMPPMLTAQRSPHEHS